MLRVYIVYMFVNSKHFYHVTDVSDKYDSKSLFTYNVAFDCFDNEMLGQSNNIWLNGIFHLSFRHDDFQ